MNKDISLILRRTVLTYTYVLFTVFILKLCGLDYFGIDASNPFILWLDDAFSVWIVRNIINLTLLIIYQHIMLSLILKEKCYKLTLFSIPLTFIFHARIKRMLLPYGFAIYGDALYLFILYFCYTRINKTKKIDWKRFICVVLLNILFQAISTLSKYIRVCGRGSVTLTIQSVPAVVYNGTSTMTQTPTIKNANISIKRYS